MSIALLGHVLILAVLLTLLLQRLIRPHAIRLYVFSVLMLAGVLLSLGGLTPVQWLRSLTGDLSLLFWVVSLNILMQRWLGRNLLSHQERKILLMVVSLAGVIFYPLALGIGQLDPYRWGYAPQVMAAVLGAGAVILWLKHHRVLAAGVLLPLLALNSGWFESVNLWDYLLDPILLSYALVQLLTMYAGRFRLFPASGK